MTNEALCDLTAIEMRRLLSAGDVSARELLDAHLKRIERINPSVNAIVTLVPELAGGIPGLSSGVERELHHAFEHTKEVYVVWKPKKNPSPFITETATRIFSSVDEALAFFRDQGMFHPGNLFGH